MARIGAESLALDFSRIEHLLSPEALGKKIVLQVGLGSGGAPVCDHLTMNGVRNWILYDLDTLQSVNLVKHPRLRTDLGRAKVDIQREWIMDRNPEAAVTVRSEDIFQATEFDEFAERADLILCCADSKAVRLYINEVAVRHRKPCITASVFRQGFGGEVYAFVPGYSGCFECMDSYAAREGLNINESMDPTAEEEEKIYGMNLPDFQASGLSLDISATALIQARMALDLLLDGRPGFSGGNWIIHFNRRVPGIDESGRLKATRPMLLRPVKGCVCGLRT